jgi:hypothetical protein
MMYRTLPLLSKRIVMPRLSPTHTAARIIRFEVLNGQNLISYDPVMILECSPDLVTETLRDTPDQTTKMMVDTQDEGVVSFLLEDWEGKFIEVGTELGVIDDGEPVDGDWTWQAYLHTEE